MCDYSLQNVKTRPAKVGDKLFTRRFSAEQEAFQHQKTSTSRFAYFQGQNCHLRTRSGAPVCGRGAKIFSTTKRRSSGRSI